MLSFRFDNAFVRELPGDPVHGPRVREVREAWSPVMPTPVAAPRVLAYSREMATALGLAAGEVLSPEFAQVFAGNRLLPGMQPFAANYGGHQFGHWAGQLGDGRAISLGETVDAVGGRWELQLKGAGRTPYSRGADGRAVLRSSIREFLCSEAMHHLGIPTTRALALLATGEEVVRDMFYDGHPAPEPGAVVVRTAPSFLRFGSFELPASRGDTGLLRQLVEFCIRRDFPHLEGEGEALVAAWFAEVAVRTARLMADWMRVGFVHGVMNTDNLSILGLTIDYGPYGWIDDYDPDWTPNTTDAQRRRYRFGQQPAVAYWNLGRLAGALSPLFADVAPLQEGLAAYVDAYEAAEQDVTARKLGLAGFRHGDDALMRTLQDWMAATEVDMTLLFRALGDLPADPDPQAEAVLFAGAFYDPARREAGWQALQDWLARYRARLAADPREPGARRERMRLANPRYVLRNYLAQQAIDRAEQGDPSGVREVLEVMRRPYEDQPGREAYAGKRPEWARERAGCSMLSCSS
ncbi:YdiU family protein [Lysobacter sp. GX 14042]|uniref:protein adenylyltransferase SelO n=1 Tax=Lysobacter sp. GX 14042 TaxID=2907155 RepID=UPI001F1946CB|nr:YdiU family protein [Lysobacter sp. GX 14042]MCE7031554.1 YdiU family protein [Lysobacter sp. GX 14042]